jgi:mTERF
MEALRTLIVRYPYVLSKSVTEVREFFNILKAQGLTDEETMKTLLDIPKLISKKDLDKKIKEIQFLFKLYH